ncbi:MAG TPA: hypothetical protein VFE63_10715 [Roseiarcus sp.]|nr:hypothetical protein [Roseiarcus sp.]
MLLLVDARTSRGVDARVGLADARPDVFRNEIGESRNKDVSAGNPYRSMKLQIGFNRVPRILALIKPLQSAFDRREIFSAASASRETRGLDLEDCAELEQVREKRSVAQNLGVDAQRGWRRLSNDEHARALARLDCSVEP